MKAANILIQKSLWNSIPILMLIMTLSSENLHAQDITMISIADTVNQHVDIQYSSIEISEVINFDKLIRVYINSNSIIMVDMEVASLDNVGTIVYETLKSNIEGQYGVVSSESTKNTHNDLKILIRKSVYTSKENYATMLDLVNNAIWDLQIYYCREIYNTDFKSLTKEQKSYINQLLPLENYLADDVTF